MIQTKSAKAARDRIDNAITILGYTPNFGARALATNQTNTVGAIIPTLSNAMFASGIQAFQEVLSEAGITLLIATSGYDPENELRQIKSLVSQGASGLLLIGNEPAGRNTQIPCNTTHTACDQLVLPRRRGSDVCRV